MIPSEATHFGALLRIRFRDIISERLKSINLASALTMCFFFYFHFVRRALPLYFFVIPFPSHTADDSIF